jgi:ribosomal protein S18 acetylase RimI-like enzyme
MKITVREAKPSDLTQYTDLLQRTYQLAYTNESIGLTKDCFSKEVFKTQNTQEYLKSKITRSTDHKTRLAIVDNKIAGSITLSYNENFCELSGFYVLPEFQGKGIGSRLFKLAIERSNNTPITLDTYAHNIKTIEIYKRWGFEIDQTKEPFYRHWPEWPEDLQAKCIYMIRKPITLLTR